MHFFLFFRFSFSLTFKILQNQNITFWVGNSNIQMFVYKFTKTNFVVNNAIDFGRCQHKQI